MVVNNDAGNLYNPPRKEEDVSSEAGCCFKGISDFVCMLLDAYTSM